MRLGGLAAAIDWGGIVKSSIDNTFNLLTRRYGNASVAPGTLIRGADGSIVSNQTPGYPVIGGSIGVNADSSTGTGLILAVAVIGVVGVLVMRSNR